MTRYAAETVVPVNQTINEIERMLHSFGAEGFGYQWRGDATRLAFVARGRHIRFDLPLPTIDQFIATPGGATRSTIAAKSFHERALRATWRGLALIIKAKLEAIDGGIVSFEDEFLAQTVMANGKTVAEEVGSKLALSYKRGEPPALAIGGR